MTVIVANLRERAAFSALCETHGLLAAECESVRAFVRLVRRTPPKVVLVRQKLADGYSDDIIATLQAAELLPATKVIVLMSAAATPVAESRQVALGADCVLRDPVRGDVLIAYLAKFSAAADRVSDVGRRRPTSTLPFAGAIVLPVERQIRHGHQVAVVTPREIQLIEVLAHAKDTVVSYDTLYSEVLQRRFGGDTSNMRVLLGKLAASAGHIGIPLRRWIEVIPKTGYRYRSAGGPNAKPASSAAA